MYQILLLFCVIYPSNGAIEISKHLKVCNRNSLDLNDCIVEAVRDGIEKMATGIEELDIPPLDPFFQDELKVEYKNNQIAVKMLIKNIYVEGLKGSTVHDARVRADEDNFYMEVDLSAPSIVIRGDFKGEGQYNALKVKAYGDFNTSMSDLIFTWKLDGVPEKNGTDTYVRIKSFYMRPDVGNMISHLNNENPETRELTNLGTSFLNQNWRVLYRELLPYAQSNWDKIGTNVANKIFSKVPYDQIFPSGT
ncbi:juvenile hormone binding protein an-0147 precursor [Bombyx mori]|uniref:Juvenile hormone binding protein n=1 Tax=Bombyx mori TaxID=7091 RepID=Q402D6_BOMMO|nr:juvenile hormone binding protein an-0147 precursor [Bombyx mori]BAE43412.1 hypothetical protein [Bombyx mori]BAH97093.1 juvenile hormone binding protein [Bombyx mori]